MAPNKVQIKVKPEEELAIRGAHLLGPCLEAKFDELKFEILNKIDKEVGDSKNAREYISQKYNELCTKIQYLSELDATVSGFRSDVKAIERQVAELSARVDDIQKRTICKECPSLSSSVITVTK
ncbi:uncharacterized protein LOC120634181 [Pararge aegeria]|uniref:uncharacterized protein LOC120634181 n=1 Tax=Pararge aegeria TaxID=116150 RepID=UPI0019D15386|nr:uncharacterized protein LOC120634181 [Pararge aegeria]